MSLFLSLLMVQSLLPSGQVPPSLEFPEAGIDDPAAYEGYVTRFYRDTERNTVQIYLHGRRGRVVHVWADAANASAAFTVREVGGGPATLTWGAPGAEVSSDGDRRALLQSLASEQGALEIGWFLLGTMRQERDFQHFEWDLRPYDAPPWVLGELADLMDGLGRLPDSEQRRHLSLLSAGDTAELRSRLHPRLSLHEGDGVWSVLVEHTSLDGRNRMTIELEGDLSASAASLSGDAVTVRSRTGDGLRFDVTVTTDAEALTPLDREVIFNDAFGRFYERQRSRGGPSFRRLQRSTQALELISSTEKLLASLPNYATYFGRDQMMAALMLEPIVSVDVQEAVIGSVLRKVDASGDVSHEEALGGQAIRENAAAYRELVRSWQDRRGSDPEAAEASLAAARTLLQDLQAVRENHRMVDDDFQLPILVDRYLARADVPPSRKRAFFQRQLSGEATQLDALVRNLALVAEAARPYAADPTPGSLVGFLFRSGDAWLPGSWRDSGEGYGRGRFGMDVNVMWVPKALEASGRVLSALDALGSPVGESIDRIGGDASALQGYLGDPARLRAHIGTWRGARRHFEIELTPEEIRPRLATWLATLPQEERAWWQERVEQTGPGEHPLGFLALALDESGQPIAVANSDPATDLFLEEYTERVLAGASDPAQVLRMLDVFARPYPVGLFVEGLGPVVANDAYADAAVQERFRSDRYHSPYVVWGREVNLLLLGLAKQIRAAYDESGTLRDDSVGFRRYVESLRDLLEATQRAVEASGLAHNELWSYRIEGGALRPVRYGASSDIQLWNLTDLAVRFLLDGLPPR